VFSGCWFRFPLICCSRVAVREDPARPKNHIKSACRVRPPTQAQGGQGEAQGESKKTCLDWINQAPKAGGGTRISGSLRIVTKTRNSRGQWHPSRGTKLRNFPNNGRRKNQGGSVTGLKPRLPWAATNHNPTCEKKIGKSA